jgi:hypothetical protein
MREPAIVTRRSHRAGILLSALPIVFLLWDSAIKLVEIAPVRDGLERLGYPATLAVEIGLLELVCVLLHVVPRTSILGTILLTGYLGGATATHVRVGDPLPTHILFPVYVGVLLWGGLFLRDRRLRALLLLRS